MNKITRLRVLPLLVLMAAGLSAQSVKPTIKVLKDGFPSGHSTPEGVAADLARAFISRNAKLFRSTCIKPFGGGENRKAYESFLKQTAAQIVEAAKKPTPPAGGPKAIRTVFASRALSKNGPASYGYATFGFLDVRFVDVVAVLRNGKTYANRTLVILDSDKKWYVHPLPSSSPLLSAGLNEEPVSVKSFKDVYKIKR